MKTNTVLCVALLLAGGLGATGCASNKPSEEDAAPQRTVVMRDLAVSDTLALEIVKRPPPAAPKQIRPKKPGDRYVWIPGRWAWQNEQYVWIKGKWVLPERDETEWVAGSWRSVKGGWVWIPGHWKEVPAGNRE